MRYLGLQVLIVVLAIGLGTGALKDAGVQLVGHVDARQTLHAHKVCKLLAAVITKQAQSEHAGIIPCRHTKM